MVDPAAQPDAMDGETATLGARAKAGDREAFQTLYDRVAPALYAWIRLRLRPGGGPPLDAQDVLQEVWLRAVRGLDRYDPACSFRGWLLAIAKHVLMQSYRAAGRGGVGGPDPSSRMEFPAEVTSIATRLSKDEAVARFVAYVQSLNDEEQKLVLYCGLEEYSSFEAGERLGITAAAAEKRWQALRARMREYGGLRDFVAGALD